MNELYRNFLDRKFDELLQAIQALTPVQNRRGNDKKNEVIENGDNSRRTL